MLINRKPGICILQARQVLVIPQGVTTGVAHSATAPDRPHGPCLLPSCSRMS